MGGFDYPPCTGEQGNMRIRHESMGSVSTPKDFCSTFLKKEKKKKKRIFVQLSTKLTQESSDFFVTWPPFTLPRHRLQPLSFHCFKIAYIYWLSIYTSSIRCMVHNPYVRIYNMHNVLIRLRELI